MCRENIVLKNHTNNQSKHGIYLDENNKKVKGFTTDYGEINVAPIGV